QPFLTPHGPPRSPPREHHARRFRLRKLVLLAERQRLGACRECCLYIRPQDVVCAHEPESMSERGRMFQLPRELHRAVGVPRGSLGMTQHPRYHRTERMGTRRWIVSDIAECVMSMP